MSAKISIIIPVYNTELFLEECIESVLNQSFTDFELILIDDGSLDKSGAICDVYKEKDSRIRVIHQTNKGQAAARNRAISISEGDWICFVDSDDMIHPSMLKSLFDAAIEMKTDISACEKVEADVYPEEFWSSRSAHYKTIKIEESALKHLYENNSSAYWCVWAKLIRKDIVKSLPFTAGRFYEDNAIMCQWLKAAEKICITDSKYYFYRINPGGTTKGKFGLKQLDYLWALQEQMNFYKKNGYSVMESILAARYLEDAIWIHKSVLNQLHDVVLGEKITHQMQKIYYQYRKKLPLKKWELEEIDLFLFPKKKWFYKAKHAVARIKRYFISCR